MCRCSKRGQVVDDCGGDPWNDRLRNIDSSQDENATQIAHPVFANNGAQVTPYAFLFGFRSTHTFKGYWKPAALSTRELVPELPGTPDRRLRRERLCEPRRHG